MTEEPQDLEDVRRRLEEIQNRKRGGIRWNVSKHTAELAIVAIETGGRGPQPSGKGKGRRRKRAKRLL
ncbi:MAG TPA: hypothetical protein VK636_14155 [Gemmatimonadaceae bacterium]|nr:hypothetical protein [Gemmatimonadaceae bacterium]